MSLEKGAVRRQWGENTVLGLQQLIRMGMLLLDPWQMLASICYLGKQHLWAASAKTRKGQGAGRTAMAKMQECGLTGYPFPPEHVRWPGTPLCLLLGHFPQALPTTAVLSQASQCTAMEKRNITCW